MLTNLWNMSALCEPGFCPDCGSILPYLKERGNVICFSCRKEFGPEVYSADVETKYVVQFNTINKKSSSKSEESDEGPVVERRCPKCSNDKMSYATLQLRSADEGQTVFYTCTKCNQQWVLDKQDLVRERQYDLGILTEEEYQKIFIFFSNFIQTLGEQLKLRQQVIATATVYFKRFYARNSLKCIDPLLLAPTCVFLASKVEEFGVISNSRLISTCQTVVKNKFSYAYSQEFPYRSTQILECEFYLLENLDCCLIVYQPYRPLLQLLADIGHEDQLLALAWRVVNDSLRTDVCLLYPPYQIAIGCLQIACVVLQKDLKSWFAELNVDIEKIQEIVRYVISLFELWKTYDEKKEVQALLNKMPKPKVQPATR